MAQRGLNIVQEPCTLVYTLLDPKIVKFEDFCLIIRSLHSYMVESIVPNAEYKSVHVKLNYQASLPNAQQKLGTLQSAVGVTKLNSHVKECEFAHLEQLRRKFGIGAADINPQYPRMGQRMRQPGPIRRRGTKRVFNPRPEPYQPSTSYAASPLQGPYDTEGDCTDTYAIPVEEVSE